MKKTCRYCGEPKSLDDFYNESRGALGRGSYCKPCKRVMKRAWERANPDKRRAQERKTRSRPEFKARARARIAAYREAKGESIRESRNRVNLAWHKRNVDRMRVANRAGGLVRRALAAGKLVKALACEICGRSDKRLDAAHADYVRPLEVRWLCRSCHVTWDQAEPKTKDPRAAEILGVAVAVITPEENEVAA